MMSRLDMRKKLLIGLAACFLQSAFGQSELLINGGFEAGAAAPWVVGGAGANITNNPAIARSGVNSLSMGNVQGASQFAYQTFTIPTIAIHAVLSYYWNVSSQDLQGVDELAAWLVGTNQNILATVDARNNFDADSDYHLTTYDLQSFIGQTVKIYFVATNDAFYGTQTGFHIDDVSVQYVTTADLPQNDSFTNRTVMTSTSFIVTATNTFASKEPGEPKHANNSASKSLWWAWTAPVNGTVSLNTGGSSFDTVLAVYIGDSVSNLTSVAADDNGGSGQTSALRFPVIAGTQYQIAVDGAGGDSGTIGLHFNFQFDNKAPSISISSPESGIKLTNSTVVVKGKASDNLGVAFVEFRLENSVGTNAYQPAVGSNSWSATVTDLVPGMNTVRVRAHDISGNVSATTTHKFNYVIVSPLTVIIDGSGAVSPALSGRLLEVGARYTLKAKPGAGYIFASWTHDLASENSTLGFTMQSNLVLQANFIPNPFISVAGNYQGLFYDTNGITHPASGFFSAKVTGSGSFSAKILVAGKSYSRSGKFSAMGVYSNSIPRKGLSPLSIQLQLDLAGGNVITGQLSDGSWMAQVTANRAMYSKLNPAPQAGRYTWMLPNSTSEPGGNSFGVVTVSASGSITFAATMGDGAKASQSALLSGSGQWPLYVSLYGGQGSILSWVTFTNFPGYNLFGPMNWIRLTQLGSAFYPAGFTNAIDSFGSTYKFTNGIPVLNFTTGQVFLANGNISQGFSNQVALSAASKVTNLSSNSLSLTIKTSSGLFKGSVVNPATGKAIPFSGVIVQSQNAGNGFFRGTNETGMVIFGP
jgi:Divergent InlB B-repeat domain/Bacterial Ig domain